MRCLHPYCPAAAEPTSWDEILDLPGLGVRPAEKAAVAACLNSEFAAPPSEPAIARDPPPLTIAALKRLLNLCPCLFNQIDISPSARAVVHFCELTLGGPITSANVHQAFLIQHPNAPGFSPAPLKSCSSGGTVMEMLCSEVLSSAGIPAMRWGRTGGRSGTCRAMSSLTMTVTDDLLTLRPPAQ